MDLFSDDDDDDKSVDLLMPFFRMLLFDRRFRAFDVEYIFCISWPATSSNGFNKTNCGFCLRSAFNTLFEILFLKKFNIEKKKIKKLFNFKFTKMYFGEFTQYNPMSQWLEHGRYDLVQKFVLVYSTAKKRLNVSSINKRDEK